MYLCYFKDALEKNWTDEIFCEPLFSLQEHFYVPSS